MAAGTTVLSTIASLYGNDTRAWVGKEITIYGDPNVSFGGAKVGGVRVRPVVPKQSASTSGGSSKSAPKQPESAEIDLAEALEIQRREAEENR